MTHKTNLQYADQSLSLMELETIRVESGAKHHSFRAPTVQKIAADIYDFLTEKEWYACNRATD